MNMNINIILIAITLFSFSWSPNWANAQWEQTPYSELAKSQVPVVLEQLSQNLALLTEMVPPTQIRDLRKLVGKSKMLLDLYIYAYPKNMGQDLWADERDQLDQGYAVLGEYKDLSDMVEQLKKYGLDGSEIANDVALAQTRWERVAKWRVDFLQSLQAQSMLEYFQQPSLLIVFRSQNELPKNFWDLGPLDQMAQEIRGESFKNLAQVLVQDEIKLIEDIVGQSSLLSLKAEQRFHLVRKRLRNLLKLQDLFPGLLPGMTETRLKLLTQAVDNYGQLHDLLGTYFYLKENSMNDLATSVGEIVQVQWATLLTWQQDNQLAQEVRQLETPATPSEEN